MKEIEVKQLSSVVLAYIGDAVYELYVRKYLMNNGQMKTQHLHQQAVEFVSGKAQAAIVLSWLETGYLTEEETRVVKRGRNTKSLSVPRNIDVQSYRYSTGFEALIGYHHLLKNEQRLNELLAHAIQMIEEGKIAHD